MGPHLKQHLWGLSIAIIGAALAIVGILLLSTRGPHLASTPAVFGTIVLFIGIIVDLAANEKEAALAWRWFRLGLGEFPRDKVEREALRQFAKENLCLFAENASLCFKNRDEDGLALAAAKSNASTICAAFLSTPKDLLKFRKAKQQRFNEIRKLIRERGNTYKKMSEHADRAHRRYLKHWDLFKDLGMLPNFPGTSDPWSNPDEFRLKLTARSTRKGSIQDAMDAGVAEAVDNILI